MKKNYSEVEKIAGKHLGRKGGEGYKDQYDPSLLVPIPRYLNRTDYGIKEDRLPFVGYDVWNAYEVSALTEKGFPVTGMLKIVCPADTKYHVESKSIKLYLNSFNMTKMGANIFECIQSIQDTVEKDLSDLLGGDVRVGFFTELDRSNVTTWDYRDTGTVDINEVIDLDSLTFDTFKSDASQLQVRKDKETSLKVQIDFLRSNCRVTNQPDWGNLLIYMEGPSLPTYESLAKYVVSHRQVNHFHEEIVEMVYMHLEERFRPNDLTVAALYSRRGGLDINPIRSNNILNIPFPFTATDVINQKTLMQ